MGVLALFLFFFAPAVAVKTDTAELRAGCDHSDDIVGSLPLGTPVELRFAMNGSAGSCYKVTATVQGKFVQGYVVASSLSGLEEFQKGLASALALSGVSSPGPATAATSGSKPTRQAGIQYKVPINSQDHPLVRASSLLQQKQPGAALDAVEKGMSVYGRDYQFLVLAGIAAYESDDLRRASEYLKESQQLKEDRAVGQFLAKIEKESAGDASGEKLYGYRFVLRYEGGKLAPDVARSMIDLLEQEFSRISGELGCRTDERIVTVVQSPQAYRASTDAAEWSGGQFDGKIRVPIIETGAISAITRKTFAHELVHACLATLGHWPSWLHEGLAQKLSGDASPPAARRQMAALIRADKMPRLENMSQSWSRMSAQHAAAAYAYSLLAVELLYQHWSGFGIQNVLRNPDRLPQITADLDRRLAE